MKKTKLFVKTLKEQVYEYLKEKIQKGEIKPGESINLERTSSRLGISRTPLRDALLQLEFEGFVTIKPRKGIIVNSLEPDDIKKIYQIIGALEGGVIFSLKGKIREKEVEELKSLNKKMEKAIDDDDFDTYYSYNLKFHNLFLRKADNRYLTDIIDIKKKRLYDFRRKNGFVRDWEKRSVSEHQKIIEFLEKGDFKSASEYMRDIHWSYEVQKKYIKQYYESGNE
jgi:DNA-binding GntR family transcriptional regulator